MQVQIPSDKVHRKRGIQSIAVVMVWLCFLLPLVQSICASSTDRESSISTSRVLTSAVIEQDGLHCVCDLFGLSVNEEYVHGRDDAPHADPQNHRPEHPIAPPEYRACHREQLTPPPDRPC